MKSALFVDFDNIYSGLKRLDVAAADRFAFQPQNWIRWLNESLPAPAHAPADTARRLLVRRCYLNPQVYQRFRPSFNRAGFEIVDCPAMTSEGKTSTDIHMVLDIVDLLQHEVHYDEFIVFSADADFTPVLRKLRRWDRRTTVLAIGFPSAAYQASADLLIDQDDFVRRGLGFDEPEQVLAPTTQSRPKDDVAKDVSAFIARAVAASARPVALPWLASKAPAEVPGLDVTDWAGFNSFRALVDSLALSGLLVRWDAGVVLDPGRHATPERAAAAKPMNAANGMSAVVELVRNEVAAARRPVPCGRLAQLITDQHGAIAADWGGKGTFRRFLEALDLGPLRVDWSVAGGCVTDLQFPAEQPATSVGSNIPDWDPDNELLPVLNQVHDATGMPLLSPSELRAVLDCLIDDLSQQTFQLTETGKRVRDRCREAGYAVSRADVNFVLKGILLSGHAFGQGTDEPSTLGRCLLDSVLELCRREQLPLDESQTAQLGDWAERAAGAR